MSPVRHRACLAAVTVSVLLTTACHGADGAAGPSGTASSATAPSATAPATADGTPPIDELTPTDEPTPGTGVPSFPAGAASAAPARSTCTSVDIAVLRGSGAPGQQFAALQFTNTGSTTCVLNGYPTVTLQLAGKAVGSPSTPAGTATSTRTLAPGAVAQAGLHDYVTNCDAPLSDTVTVVAPGSSIRASHPITLRPCTLRVDPLGAPS